jgi:hypothetical protein
MFAMPEENKLVACADICVFCRTAGLLAEVEETAAVESERVGVNGRATGKQSGDPECGAFGDGGAVREGEGFFRDAVEGYYLLD